MEKLFKQLRVWDGVWAIPAAFISFVLFEVLLHRLFGAAVAAYDPSIFQAAISAAAILIIGNSVVQFALLFNFPNLWKAYLNPDTFNAGICSKEFYMVAVYFAYLLLYILLFLKLV